MSEERREKDRNEEKLKVEKYEGRKLEMTVLKKFGGGEGKEKVQDEGK